MRDIHLSHQTVHNWTQPFGVELGLKLREKRYGQSGKKWHLEVHWVYMNNKIASDHRVTKSRLSIMKGFKIIFCALTFCTVFEEVRQFFRMKKKTRAQRRSLKIKDYQQILPLAA